jgi:hypothetical protein
MFYFFEWTWDEEDSTSLAGLSSTLYIIYEIYKQLT